MVEELLDIELENAKIQPSKPNIETISKNAQLAEIQRSEQRWTTSIKIIHTS